MEKTATKPKKTEDTPKYFEGLGRRKTSVARVRIYPNKTGKDIIVNGKKHGEYFDVLRYRNNAVAPLKLVNSDVYAEIKVSGGGIMAQADAIALGIGRALIKWTPSFKPLLRSAGFLTRDSRAVERKKPGLRKARRAHQWKKR